ncbi:LytR C-terminal domain-containing protein [Streptomyces sp. B6B3]|uniref:LytR C-terminal domain-containing protein n=1 Tax=Streptomyces sp. B6B3 TaxID=3153570 RepID=UPI00325EEA61
MSMLTPPGMGGRKYRITGNRYPRMRRRPRRGRVVLGALAVFTLIGLLSYGTLQLVDVFTADEESGGGPATAAGASRPGPDCQPAAEPERTLPEELPEPKTITVNVYNATKRTGLAQQTADALAERGFVIGEVDNAPASLDGKVAEPGLLLASSAAEESGALAVVGAQLDGAETGEPKPKGGAAEIDLVIGSDFTELRTPREADERLVELQTPDETPATTPETC